MEVDFGDGCLPAAVLILVLVVAAVGLAGCGGCPSPPAVVAPAADPGGGWLTAAVAVYAAGCLVCLLYQAERSEYRRTPAADAAARVLLWPLILVAGAAAGVRDALAGKGRP